jgi:hypothetical protein
MIDAYRAGIIVVQAYLFTQACPEVFFEAFPSFESYYHGSNFAENDPQDLKMV